MDMCAMRVYAGDLTQPPEFCDEVAEPGEDYCIGHLVDENPWTELDEDVYRDDLVRDAMEVNL